MRIGHAHSGEPVRDEDRGPPLRKLTEALEDRVLRLGVERGGGLVEHQDVGLLAHERAGEGDLLPLAAGQLGAVLEPAPERGVEPLGERRHDLARAAALHGPLDPRLVVPCDRRCPSPTFSRTLSWYWLKSWKMTPKRLRSSVTSQARRSRPSSRMRPSVGS